jgi:hypothetical protein
VVSDTFGTESSNPASSSGESTNFRFPVASASRLSDAPRGLWRQGGRIGMKVRLASEPLNKSVK